MEKETLALRSMTNLEQKVNLICNNNSNCSTIPPCTELAKEDFESTIILYRGHAGLSETCLAHGTYGSTFLMMEDFSKVKVYQQVCPICFI